MSKFYQFLITVLFIVVLASALPTSAHAAPLQGGSKPVCTVSSSWLEKLLGLCNDIKATPPVVAPPVVTIDTAK